MPDIKLKSSLGTAIDYSGVTIPGSGIVTLTEAQASGYTSEQYAKDLADIAAEREAHAAERANEAKTASTPADDTESKASTRTNNRANRT